MTRRVFIAIWILAVNVVIAAVMARHQAPFQSNPSLVLAAQSLAEKQRPEDPAAWLAIHILDPRCRCSANILEEIIQSKYAQVRQLAVVVSPLTEEWRTSLTAARIPIESLTAERAEKEFKIETVPWLVILNSKLEVLYSGGYGRNKLRQAKDIQLAEIYQEISSGRSQEGFPVYGCVTSENLRQRLLYLSKP